MKFQHHRYTVYVYMLYVYLCFIHKKSKSFLLPETNFHPLEGDITPFDNAWS